MTRSKKEMHFEIYTILKFRSCFFSSSNNFGIELGPIPCSEIISFLEYFDKSWAVSIPLFSKARLAGADNTDKSPESGLRSCSQIGQVGQSLVLK